jgi:hypothetical protein
MNNLKYILGIVFLAALCGCMSFNPQAGMT